MGSPVAARTSSRTCSASLSSLTVRVAMTISSCITNCNTDGQSRQFARASAQALLKNAILFLEVGNSIQLMAVVRRYSVGCAPELAPGYPIIDSVGLLSLAIP